MEPHFDKLDRLPPYVFAEVDKLKMAARRAGADVIDLGMGNPDLPTPPHIVEKIRDVALNPKTHRYSSSRGIDNLRAAISEWYARKFDVQIDPETEAVSLIGSKEGLAHFVLMTVGPGDRVICPDPGYPIHQYSVVIAGGDLHCIAQADTEQFFVELEREVARMRTKLIILSYPHNPTTRTADLSFFRRAVALAREHGVMIVHDFAYAEVCFDGYKPPSIFQVPGARDVAIEFISLSKSHSMAGWRVGFACGNPQMIHALTRMKSYLDYGIPTPIQVGAILALRGPQDCVDEHVGIYESRRNTLIDGLAAEGNGAWEIEKPRATMFVWAPLPAPFKAMGSLEFSKLLLKEAGVAVSPGIGFGAAGEGFVRFALIENEHRIRQAVRNVRQFLARARA
ncbi:MAG: aminotransferase class I/II-fold pyridoxal phosphate-dependent enzyme [Pseudomonadota bacterium]